MSNKKGLSFPFLIIAIVIGSAIYREFSFETYRFEKPALVVVYILTLGMCVYFMVRGNRERKQKY